MQCLKMIYNKNGISMEIYKITNKINGKIYVGKSSKNDPTYFGSGLLINKALVKYGKENFVKEILEVCNTREELNEKEIFWISYYDSTNLHTGYNLTYGGDGGDTISLNPNRRDIIKRISESNTGKILTECHKGNISKSKIGKSNGGEGRKLSNETIQKISEAKKNKPLSESHKENLRIAQRKRTSSGALGTKRTSEQLKARQLKYEKEGSPKGFKIIVIDKDNNIKEFKSAREAARNYNCSVHKILNNKMKNFNITILR